MQTAPTTMKTERKNRGPFAVTSRAIQATLQGKAATLRCDVQYGRTPLGRQYRTAPQWWIKFTGTPCFSGPWTADMLRTCF